MLHKQILCINIMRYLALRGLTKTELAAKADVSLSYISQVTNSKGNPSLETVAAIADALEVPLVALLETPAVGTDDWNSNLTDSITKDDAKLGLPHGYRRISAIVTEHQAFQISKWHSAAHNRLKHKQ